MIIIIKLEKRMANTCFFHIFVSKFSYWEEFNLIILLIIDENPEIGFYYTILFLALAIILKMKSNRKFLLDF